MTLDLRSIARALGGEISGRQVLAPGPGHSPGDRSLSVRLSHQSPTGWITFSHAGDSFDVCRDYVAAKLGLEPDVWKRHRPKILYNVQDKPNAPTGNTAKAGRLLPSVDNIHEREERPAETVDNVHGLPSDHAARIARARILWDEAADPRGTMVEVYLRGRGLDLDDEVAGTVLRFHARCPWRDEAENRTIFVPAMVAPMRAIDSDAITAVQRTRLTEAGVKVARRMLGIASGAAIKLDADADVTMGLTIGEGCETVLAARQLGFTPGWSLGSAGTIAGFPVLAGIECLTILAENDDANRKAVEVCAARWHAAEREVVVVEPASGSDILDAMRGAA